MSETTTTSISQRVSEIISDTNKMTKRMETIEKIKPGKFPSKLTKINTFEFLGEQFYYSSKNLNEETRVKGMVIVYNLRSRNKITVVFGKREEWIEKFEKKYIEYMEWDI